jgi:hypothetical protein
MTALNAPRHLNEWECCVDSSLSHTSAPDRSDNHDERTSGVRRTYGAILRLASKTSSSLMDSQGERYAAVSAAVTGFHPAAA